MHLLYIIFSFRFFLHGITGSTHCSRNCSRILSESYHRSIAQKATVSSVMSGRSISYATLLSDSFHGERQNATHDCSLKAMAWIFVVFPPLLFPMLWGHLFFWRSSRRLMSSNCCGIYVGYLKRKKMFLYEKRKNSMKYSTFTPSHPSCIDGMPISIGSRKFSPLSPSNKNIENCWKCSSIIYLWLSSSFSSRTRKKWFDYFHPGKRNQKIPRKIRYFFHTSKETKRSKIRD